MTIQIERCGIDALARYAAVSIAFTVYSRLRVELVENGLGGVRLVEEPVDAPYVKDYDVDESPTQWPALFDMRRWAIFLATDGTSNATPLGAALVAFDTPGIIMLEGRTDLSVLWDLRVQPQARGKGVGAALFHAAEDWSRAQGSPENPLRQMKIETQNINVNACRFYAHMGAVLGGLNRFAYIHQYPQETQLLWYKQL